MRFRILALGFLLAVVACVVTWLSVQPVLASLMEAVSRFGGTETAARDTLSRVRAVIPFFIALDLAAVSFVAFTLLYLVVGRPLGETERAIESLAQLRLDVPLESGGPLLSKIQASLVRMADALKAEQEITRRQVRELKVTNEQLTRAQTELVSADRLATVGKLAAGVAHEVGNPLAGIMGYVSLIRTRAKDKPEVVELLDPVEKELKRIDQIVRSLLDLGRPSKSGVSVIALGPLVESAVKLLSASSEFRNVQIDLQVPPEVRARGEAGPLSQVLINLLLNAAQAMASRGTIEIRAALGSTVVLTVADSGPGIPADVLPRLFEPFFTTKGAGKGTGLGLAVSRHLISSAGGTLEAGNRPEGGAIFTITLPPA